MGLHWTDLIGYAASALAVASLTMRSILRMRWIGLVASVAFATYGALTRAGPVLFVNTVTTGLTVWHLMRIYLQRDFFSVMAIRGVDAYTRRFLKYHDRDTGAATMECWNYSMITYR